MRMLLFLLLAIVVFIKVTVKRSEGMRPGYNWVSYLNQFKPDKWPIMEKKHLIDHLKVILQGSKLLLAKNFNSLEDYTNTIQKEILAHLPGKLGKKKSKIDAVYKPSSNITTKFGSKFGSKFDSDKLVEPEPEPAR